MVIRALLAKPSSEVLDGAQSTSARAQSVYLEHRATKTYTTSPAPAPTTEPVGQKVVTADPTVAPAT